MHDIFPITLGVVADTHIPDRRRMLDPRVLPLFGERKVNAILHAGDVSAAYVLSALEQVAPVYAVRGNRDWLWLRSLPDVRRLELGGVKIGMTHGHGGWLTYLLDRPAFMLRGYYHARLIPRLIKLFPDRDVIVFGHGHLPLNQQIDGKLFFNPGSPHFPAFDHVLPSLGILSIHAGGEVCGEIIALEQPLG